MNEPSLNTSRLHGRLWRWHFFAAFIVIPFVLWQSVTGTLYLWSERWVDAAHPELRLVTAGSRALPLSEQIQAALQSAQRAAAASPSASPRAASDGPVAHAAHHGGVPGSAGLSVQRVLVSEEPGRSTAVLLQEANGLPFPVFVNPYTGTVLGTLSTTQWLPGITRALHGGWPLGAPGSWLLELGDGWALVMIGTGLYLWWPRGRGVRALWPRFHAGTRVLLRDLHSCVAVWFSIVFIFFLISALPWTAFWGGKLLAAIESSTGQSSPAGFSPGGASVEQFAQALQPVERAVSAARSTGVHGTLDVRLAPWPGAPLFITNTHVLPSQDRTLLADAGSGTIHGDYTNAELPALPRFVALGVHVHQADFGAVNVWLNTAFASSLVWLTITGVLSWWQRRPRGTLAPPPRVRNALPRFVLVTAGAMCVLLPILGLSVLLLLLMDAALGSRLQRVARAEEGGHGGHAHPWKR
jgi:uncharacterized iron-regulated membrane protein